MENIATKIHKLLEGKKQPFPDAPLYVIDNEIIKSIESKQFDNAYKQVNRAGFGNLLPWPSIILEFTITADIEEDNGQRIERGVTKHCICHMQMQSGEASDGSTQNCIWIRSIVDMTIPQSYAKVKKNLVGNTESVVLLFEHGIKIYVTPAKDDGDNILEAQIEGVAVKSKIGDADTQVALEEVEIDVVRRAHYLAHTILNTSGIEKTIIEPSGKLNKARIKSGKSAIPTHYIMRIAHVYDRDGNRTKYIKGHTKVHMRAGHIRQQAHGPHMSLRKPIWIPAVLVNYKPDGIIPRKVML